MTFYIFQCGKQNLLAATSEPEGTRLPPAQCSEAWHFLKQVEPSGAPGPITLPFDEAKAAIEQDGFYIVRPRVLFTERVMKTPPC
jgi:hypothetical protein